MKSSRLLLKLYIATLLFNQVFSQSVIKATGQNNSNVHKTIVTFDNHGHPPCGTDLIMEREKANNPDFARQLKIQTQIIQNEIAREKASRSGSRSVYTIPVVFHVIHRGEALGVGSNISDAQVLSGLDAMNRDFRRTSADGGIANSGPLGVDTEIEFCIAQKDPSGNPTTGIVRVDGTSVTNYAADGITNPGNEIQVKALSIWDPTYYYNVWIVAEIDGQGNYIDDPGYSGGVQGYAYLPVGGSLPPSDRDGCVIIFSASGNDPSGANGYSLWSPTNKGRTLTHEVGHSLFLYHTFEGGSCSESNCNTDGDEVCDTPPTTVGTGNNCSSPQCSGSENKENYMQYQNGSCASDFTQGQKDRMRAVLNTTRNLLVTNTNCLSPFPINPYVQNVIYPNDSSCTNNITGKAVVCNGGTSTLTSFTVKYDIDGASPQTYNWTGSLASNTCDTITFPMIVTTNGNHNYNVRIDSVNVNGSVPDDYAGDNAKTSAFYSINGNGITVDITTDCKADDISWEIVKIPGGAVWASGSGYAPGIQNIFEEACLDSGCFEFRIYDVGGNGLKKNGLCPTDGYFTVTDLSSNLPIALIGPNPNFGYADTFSFCMPYNPTLTVDYDGCDSIFEGEAISFTDLTTGVPNPITWNWDFGDGGTSTQQNPTHAYSSAGTYSVKLVVFNGALTDSIIKANCIIVSPRPPGYCDTLRNYNDSDSIVAYKPLGSWGYIPGHNGAGLIGFAEPFNLSTPSNSIQKVRLPVIRAYNGSPTSSFSVNVYTNNAGKPGTIITSDTVLISSLTEGVMNEIQLTSPPLITGDFWVGFEVDTTNGDTLAIGTALSYSGRDSTMYVKAGPLWLYSKTIIGINTSLGIDVIYTDLPAIGTYTVSKTNICAGQTITFDASSASNYDNLTWFFPGGTPSTSTNVNVTVTYPTAGNYDAILYLESICSNDSNKTLIKVDGSAPVVSFTETATSICQQDTIMFDGSGTTGTNMTRLWTFPTGIPSSSTKIADTVRFNTGGIHNVKLAAYNGCGGDSVIKPITVNAFPSTVVTPHDTTICKGSSVTLTGSGGTTYKWNTGATTTSINVTPTVTTTYWVTTSNGVCAGDTVYADVNINPIPNVRANASPADTICLGGTVNFTMNGSNAIYYQWNFGDGVTSNVPNTTHAYSSIGNYTITLKGTYGLCDSTHTIYMYVKNCSGGGGPSGVEENELANLVNMYPNPANSMLNIDATNTELQDLAIEIFSNTGEAVFKKRFNSINQNIITIDLENYAKGMYLVKFEALDHVFIKRLIIFK